MRVPDGEEKMGPWDLTCFPTGPEGAHAVRNETSETLRIMMFSNVETPAVTVYPDSDKVGTWTGNPDDDVMVHKSSKVDYFSGEAAAGERGMSGAPRDCRTRGRACSDSTTRATRSG